MYSFSENNTFSMILNRLLANVSDSFDKREGSIIYDALAPAAAELAQCYIALDVYVNQTNLLNATGENLDNRAADYGLTRIPATAATAKISVVDINNNPMAIEIGTRFSIPNEYGGYTYRVKEQQSTGIYLADCETLGEVGNRYVGDLLPLQSVLNLGLASIISIEKPGEDIESDDAFRQRAINKLNQTSFAGNKAAYREMAIENKDFGVADCKVFPAWNGGGTVKLAMIGPGHTLLSNDAIQNIQTQIDPITNQGKGLGLAPIGHQVTVVTPTADIINITATVELEPNTIISDVQEAVNEQVQNYIYQIQDDFINNDSLLIYLSKVSAAILNVKLVKNVSSLSINGEPANYEVESDAINVKYPVLSSNGVVLIEA